MAETVRNWLLKLSQTHIVLWEKKRRKKTCPQGSNKKQHTQKSPKVKL